MRYPRGLARQTRPLRASREPDRRISDRRWGVAGTGPAAAAGRVEATGRVTVAEPAGVAPEDRARVASVAVAPAPARAGRSVSVRSSRSSMGHLHVSAFRPLHAPTRINRVGPVPARAAPSTSWSARRSLCPSLPRRAADTFVCRVPGAIANHRVVRTRCPRWRPGSPSSLHPSALAPCSPFAPRSPRQCPRSVPARAVRP